MRASAQTTANLSKHWFLKGYVAYGFKDRKVKGMGEVTYSFNKKDYLPREFPVNNLTFNYTNDVMAPSDRFMPTDKDNVFTSFKWTDVRHMMYYETYRLTWDKELTISSMCTVFAESEVISLIADNHTDSDIIHGLNKSIAGKTAAMAARAKGQPPYMMTGGVARNRGVVQALEEKLGAKLLISENPDLCGALGAAQDAVMQDHVPEQINKHRNGAKNAHNGFLLLQKNAIVIVAHFA